MGSTGEGHGNPVIILAESAAQSLEAGGIAYQHGQHNALNIFGIIGKRNVETLTIPAVMGFSHATHGTGVTHWYPVQPIEFSLILKTLQIRPTELVGRPNVTEVYYAYFERGRPVAQCRGQIRPSS